MTTGDYPPSHKCIGCGMIIYNDDFTHLCINGIVQDTSRLYKMKLTDITDEHIKEFAKLWSINNDEVVEITRGNDFARLNWKTHDSYGYIFISDSAIVFSSKTGADNVGLEELRYLAKLGYEIL